MMKERSARLVAAKRARASAKSGAAAVGSYPPDTSNIASTSSSGCVSVSSQQRETPQLAADPSQGASFVEELDVNSDEYESEDDTFDDDRAQDVFDEFILRLPLDHRRMLAVLLAESFRTRQWMGIVDAAREAGSVVGYSDKTVRKLRKQLYESKGVLRRGSKASTSE